MIAKKLLTTIAFALVLLFSGCAEDDFNQVDGLCPVVESTIPGDKDTDVPLNQVITATFNEKMNPSTINGASFTVGNIDGLINGNVTYTDSTAVFTPSSLLDEDTEYTGTITTLAEDQRGNALQEDNVWTFTTVPPLPQFTVVVSSNPIIGGVTAGGGLFDEGTAVTVTAVPNAGYNFINWTDNGTQVSTNADYEFVLTADITLVANYSLKPPTQFDVILSSNPALGGLTSGAGSYDEGATVTVTATQNADFNFVNWTENGVIVPNAGASYQFVLTQDRNLTANFTPVIIPVNSGLCDPNIVNLGMARNYAILAETAVTATGVTSITGDVGISPNSAVGIEGFGLIMDPSGTFSTSSLVTGNIYAADYTSPTPSNLTTTVDNMHTAFTTANSLAPDYTEYLAGNLNNVTLDPGVYKYGTDLLLTNTITLDGGGVDCAAFVFQIAGSLTVNPGTKIILINGAKADNIYWVVAGAGATLNTDVDFSGTILSQTLISLAQRTVVNGRLLAQSGVTLIGNTVVMPSN